MAIPNLGAKYIAGSLADGHLLLSRDDGTTDRVGVVFFTGGTLTDNEDSTFDLAFE